MKLNTIDHPKTFDLSDRLGIGLAQTLGHLTLLWAFTGRKAPQGNIGKWPDGAIARACDWQGDSKMFVQALVDAGYLKRHDDYRLLVHDWPDHAERWVKASLKKLGQDFIYPTTGRTTEPTTDGDIEPSPCPDQTRQVKDIGQQADRTRSDSRFNEFWQAYPRKVKKKPALDLWKRRKLDRIADQIIRDVVARAERDPQWQEATKLIPHPSTYLSAERWTDEWDEPKTPEDRWTKCCRLAKERGLEPFRGAPHETPEQFMARVGA